MLRYLNPICCLQFIFTFFLKSVTFILLKVILIGGANDVAFSDDIFWFQPTYEATRLHSWFQQHLFSADVSCNLA